MSNPWNNKPWENHPWKNQSWNGGNSDSETDVLGALESAMKDILTDSEPDSILMNDKTLNLEAGGLYLKFFDLEGTDKVIFEQFLNEAGIGSQDIDYIPVTGGYLKLNLYNGNEVDAKSLRLNGRSEILWDLIYRAASEYDVVDGLKTIKTKPNRINLNFGLNTGRYSFYDENGKDINYWTFLGVYEKFRLEKQNLKDLYIPLLAHVIEERYQQGKAFNLNSGKQANTIGYASMNDSELATYWPEAHLIAVKTQQVIWERLEHGDLPEISHSIPVTWNNNPLKFTRISGNIIMVYEIFLQSFKFDGPNLSLYWLSNPDAKLHGLILNSTYFGQFKLLVGNKEYDVPEDLRYLFD
jgi:hypothetical protein